MNETNKKQRTQPASLLELCQNKLIQTLTIKNSGITNEYLISKLKNTVPYHLLLPLVTYLNDSDLLNELETGNPGLVLLTEHVWNDLLIRHFPNHLHEGYTKRKKSILQRLFNTEGGATTTTTPVSNVDDFLKYDESKQMYKIPSKLLYLKYKQEVILKEQEATLKLKKMNENLKKLNDSKSIVFLEKDEDLNKVLTKTVNKSSTKMQILSVNRRAGGSSYNINNTNSNISNNSRSNNNNNWNTSIQNQTTVSTTSTTSTTTTSTSTTTTSTSTTRDRYKVLKRPLGTAKVDKEIKKTKVSLSKDQEIIEPKTQTNNIIKRKKSSFFNTPPNLASKTSITKSSPSSRTTSTNNTSTQSKRHTPPNPSRVYIHDKTHK